MLIVGERINSSSERIALAIEKRDADFLQEEARAQVDAGAQMVDVNAGTFVDEEPACLRWLVQTVQQAVDVPLCLDSSNPAAMAAALAVHKGKALLNSVTGQKDRFDEVVSLVKQYGCSVVALCIGDQGVPHTAEERFEVATRLIQRLTNEGIPGEDIYVDPAVVPLSTKSSAAREVLDAISRVTQAFAGVHAICGVSNISFGLPLRRQLNRMFLVMAMSRGLDAAIMDPCDARAMTDLLTVRALMGDDEYCMGYISAYREGKLRLA